MRLLARVEKGEKLSALEKAKMVALLAFIYSDLNNIGTIMHGTHVAGIITQKNPSVEILGVKMGFGDGKKEAPKLYMPTKEELEKFLAEMAKEELKELESRIPIPKNRVSGRIMFFSSNPLFLIGEESSFLFKTM